MLEELRIWWFSTLLCLLIFITYRIVLSVFLILPVIDYKLMTELHFLINFWTANLGHLFFRFCCFHLSIHISEKREYYALPWLLQLLMWVFCEKHFDISLANISNLLDLRHMTCFKWLYYAGSTLWFSLGAMGIVLHSIICLSTISVRNNKSRKKKNVVAMLFWSL